MDEIQKVLIEQGHKNLAQKYYEKISKNVIKKSATSFGGYHDKMMWDISKEMANIMNKKNTKKFGVKIVHSSANAAGTFSAGVTDLDDNNYLSCWTRFKFDGHKVKFESDLETTPRSSGLKSQYKFFKEEYFLAYDLDHVVGDLIMAIANIYENIK